MLPVIRKTPSWNNGLRKKLLHCFLLAVMLGLSFFLLRSCLRRGSRLEDFSGGRYERTFRTGNSVLKKELLSLKGPILEQEWKSSGMLERFHRLHRQIPSSMRQTPAAAEAESLPGAKGEKKEGEGTLSREEWLAEFHRLLGEIRRPLKGIGESAGEFSDFLEVLRSCAGERGNNAEFPDLPLKSYPAFDNAALRMSEALCSTAKRLNIPLEYNLAGLRMRASSSGFGYTSDEFWQIAADKGCTAIIASDAHTPEDLCDTMAFDAVRRRLINMGITVLDMLPELDREEDFA